MRALPIATLRDLLFACVLAFVPRWTCRALILAVLFASTACGGSDSGGGGTPTTPNPTVTSVAVTFGGGPIYIGTQVQFQATSTMSDGTTRPATNATWGSDAPAVATVSSTGLVNPLKAGEATIFADVNPRGVLRIRVFPSFGGTWSGGDRVENCQALGAFVGAFCVTDTFKVGELYRHDSKFVQTNESVEAEYIVDVGFTAKTTGIVSVDGELQLPSATVEPSFEGTDTQVQNWRIRSDEPSRMTGTSDLYVTIPGVTGSARVTFRMENVVKQSTATSHSFDSVDGGKAREVRRTIDRAVATLRRR